MSVPEGTAAIREAIEARRSKIKTPGESLKTLERDASRKKAWWNEKIQIACMDKDGEPIQGCAWKVPRRRLTEVVLRNMCLTCPEHVKIEYLKDQTTGDIVWPPHAQMHCHPLPWNYAVVAMEEKEVIDRSRDPTYYGDVQIMIFNVPLNTNNEKTEAREIVRTLEAEAKMVEHQLSRVGYMKFTKKTGFGKDEKQLLTDEEQAAKREERNEALSAERDKMEEDVAEARDMLEGILKKTKDTPVHLEQGNVQKKVGNCTYYVSFPGFYGPTLEDIVCAKTDWPGIKLAAAHDDLPPWAGRGEIPDGSKSYIKRYTEHAINMRAVQICRLQHGFGQHKTPLSTRGGATPAPTSPANASLAVRPLRDTSSAPRPPTATGGNVTGGQAKEGGQGKGVEDELPFAGKEFYFYHGEFAEGLKSGFGMEFTNADVYYGEYKKGKRNGVGALQCANGDRIEGNFVSETRFPEAGSEPNPYTAGVSHGIVEINYASGGTYRGEMKHGRITGKGEFVSCLGERYSGDFMNGRLHGTGSMVDVVGQVWEGQWCEGAMHGEGRHSAPEMGEYEGDWVNGEFQGKGRISFRGGNTYEGFFLDNRRSGPGTLFRGNVKRVYDPRSGKKAIKSNRIYEGNWRASELRTGSMVTMTKAGVTHCAGPNKGVWYNRAVDRIKRRETQTHRKTVESLDFYGRYQTLLRTEVQKKKSRLYSKQVKQANQDLINDHVKKITAEELREVFVARAINLEQIMRVTGKQLEAEPGSGAIAKASEKLDRIAASKGRSANGTTLSRLLLSRLEEAQELQEVVRT
ncbi:MORN domain repeat containing protein [Ectocarpus siliculosus]|uniref:MORN domain repeat containing protein n=1 Tax=Ectocarpus siliculosus TaxID=2880 RepID=D8LJB5_ECTSI|nr:MORN domain repeat containing protein [Ectocarpus siliculosus]|eukprot:CBN76999.1 MORN domain repeat containing protein [Ectocarpus siliculosus]